MKLRKQTKDSSRLLPFSCNNIRFYNSDATIFNGSIIDGLFRAIDNTFTTLNTEYSDFECVESVQRYLCYYYFPLCNATSNVTAGEIIPTCDDSCQLFFDNDECIDIGMRAAKVFGSHNISAPFTSCVKTHRSFDVNPPSVSDSCIEIRG